jgi:hypothetical protein
VKGICLKRGSNRRMEKITYEKLDNLYASRSIIRMMKSRRMIWVGHVACMGR